MSAEASKVLVVDDDPSVRKALTRLLKTAGLAVRSFESAEALVSDPAMSEADCILLDVQLPGLDGLQFQEQLARRGQHPPVIFLTGHGTVPMAVRAMKHGAMHVFEKPADARELLRAVREAVAARQSELSELEETRMVETLLGSLTPREQEVLEHVATGALNKQVANALGISEKTVKVHRARGLRKLGVRSVAQLVRLLERAPSTSTSTHAA